MKIIYGILNNNNNSHYCYKPEILKTWIVPSITQCHYLNPKCEIDIISDNDELKFLLPFANFFNVLEYDDDDTIWFKNNYIHLSLNPYDFEKNAILRYIYLKNFCVKNKINNFLHLEPDVLVFSDVLEDSNSFKKYNATFLHNIAAGCCFFNNSINVLNEYVKYIRNSYSIPQIEPRGFDINEEQERYENNVKNNTGAGGVSDMHFWSLYNNLHRNEVLGQMDLNYNGIFYQTCMIDQKKDGSWKTILDDGIEIKKLDIIDNKCYGYFNGDKVNIKYLHCHGHSKLLISKYSLIKNV